jgi:hypothetical protein
MRGTHVKAMIDRLKHGGLEKRGRLSACPLRSDAYGFGISGTFGGVGATVSLEQALVGRRQEGEPVEEVLVVDFHAL